MTAARRQRKSRCFAAVFGLAAAGFGFAGSAAAATTEYVVVDQHTGLAINGFDPVAYFTDSEPKLGRDDIELSFAGAVWRFRNEGNRAAFQADPEVYMPRFGGYDPLGVARGVATPGNPQMWAVVGDRLYLFRTARSREDFRAEPASSSATADSKWPLVQLKLSP